jgi:Domain of unknown function (DUF6265)
MKKTLIAAIIILCCSAFLLTDSKTFKKLYALEGTWKMLTKRGAVCEEWKKINEHHLQNRGYRVIGKDTLVSERVALTNTEAGIFYTSTVENQNNKQPIAFKMTSAEGNTFIFENPAHDYPKRIVYKLITADSLHAYIDDGTEEPKKRQNFYYKKQ